MDTTPESMHEIATACAVECIRQQVGIQDLARLIEAYAMAMARKDDLVTEDGMRVIAHVVRGGGERAAYPIAYRHTAVTFTNGRAGIDAREVPDSIQRLFKALDDDTDPGQFVHAFLAIHPFSDGNGRTAFILYNWLSNTLDHPQALPDFDWDR